MIDNLPTVVEVQEVLSPTIRYERESYEAWSDHKEDYVTRERIREIHLHPAHRVQQVYELLIIASSSAWLIATVDGGKESELCVGKWKVSVVIASTAFGQQLTSSIKGSKIESPKGIAVVTAAGFGKPFLDLETKRKREEAERQRITDIRRKSNFKSGVKERRHRLYDDVRSIDLFPELIKYTSALTQEQKVQSQLKVLNSDDIDHAESNFARLLDWNTSILKHYELKQTSYQRNSVNNN